MTLQQRINAFSELGKFLSQFSRETISQKEGVPYNDLFFDGMIHQIKLAQQSNGWFTKENVLFAIEGWANTLTEENLTKWLIPYKERFPKQQSAKIIAVIMAGNIPLVGFHDFLCVIITGHNFIGKQSSNDKHLLPFLAKYLEYAANGFKGRINFTEEKLPAHDAVIATGSDNTARYFEYYFGKKPNIIRKNRNSVAVLTGKETSEELQKLSEDVFRYFGLGCRNVSKLFVPEGYNFDNLFKAIYSWNRLMNVAKYANNYDYNKAVYLMSLFDLLENGFLMLKEDKNYGSPIATLFYETYISQESLEQQLLSDKDKIQCVVSNRFRESGIKTIVPFGKTQKPNLEDYADDVDTIAFLLNI
ncbi:acyl-CoA reductase [Dokdonia sp. Hel_I_53]|uniref:acyl-CoA reductase n=1 Tax=Dokdonia sp. Hel_I_53 TaxID=1566287 RepID=UPI00119C3407|nr:acyl-CoA reductase [Dokdonia sp. Hel_I_53]TVZ51057.1 acyl-CoA reductase LuxC [Dokdonia sp. Hel_I_53]